jgi:translation initiation factor 1 (eIF-1/SUI1)
VYSDLRHGYTKRVTVLRKFTGDTGEIKAELRRLLGETAQVKQYEGRLEVTGHHVIKLKRWLRRLGF